MTLLCFCYPNVIVMAEFAAFAHAPHLPDFGGLANMAAFAEAPDLPDFADLPIPDLAIPDLAIPDLARGGNGRHAHSISNKVLIWAGVMGFEI